jgi:hypothetical protein
MLMQREQGGVGVATCSKTLPVVDISFAEKGERKACRKADRYIRQPTSFRSLIYKAHSILFELLELFGDL